MEEPRVERHIPKPFQDRWKSADALGGKVPGVNMSLKVEAGSKLAAGLIEGSSTSALEQVELKSRKILNLDERYPGLPRLDSRRIAREVILAHELSEEERRDTFFAAERYRLLCTRVLQVTRSLKSQVFLVTSAIAGEGKTLTATNLAFGLSSVEGKRTLLVDLDLRRPSMHRLLGVRPKPGDCVFLEKQGDWRQSLIGLRPNLQALLALSASDRPDELLNSQCLERFLAEAREEYDIILIDSAPLLVAVDTHVIVSLVDQALLVVRADSTPIDCAKEALGVLGAKALGCVLNDVKRLKYEEYYRSYYGDDRRE
jgi:capsular exopolysaccharide synthesis family protein